MKRFIGLFVLVTLGIGTWSGSALAESGTTQERSVISNDQSQDGQDLTGNPIRGLLFLAHLESSSPLRSLLAVVSDEVAALEAELAELYDDLFIDTCPTCEGG